MLTAHYVHRLPADYDCGLIRERVTERAAVWDKAPDLHFKAFLLREAGSNGASADEYSSLYLWPDVGGLLDFVAGVRFDVVTKAFGRPAFDVRMALAARRGPSAARTARFAVVEDVDLPRDADLPRVLALEAERSGDLAAGPDAVATAASLDPLRWRVKRSLLTAGEPPVGGGEIYEVLHLSAPLLDMLPRA